MKNSNFDWASLADNFPKAFSNMLEWIEKQGVQPFDEIFINEGAALLPKTEDWFYNWVKPATNMDLSIEAFNKRLFDPDTDAIYYLFEHIEHILKGL